VGRRRSGPSRTDRPRQLASRTQGLTKLNRDVEALVDLSLDVGSGRCEPPRLVTSMQVLVAEHDHAARSPASRAGRSDRARGRGPG